MASSGYFLNPNEDDEISQGHQNTLILCVGESSSVWASLLWASLLVGEFTGYLRNVPRIITHVHSYCSAH